MIAPKIDVTRLPSGRWRALAWGDAPFVSPWTADGDSEAEALRELADLLLRALLEARERVYTGEF